MKRINLSIIFITSFIIIYGQDLKVFNLKTNYKINPIGIDNKNIYLSWEIKSSKPFLFQSAYQIEIAESPEDFNKNKILWSSNKVFTDSSVNVKLKYNNLK